MISNNVTAIEAHTFEDCVKLNNVVIPEAVQSLGDYAFAGCASLTDLSLEDRKIDMSVGSHLFDGCTALNQVFTFPGVTKFTDYMYANTGLVANAVSTAEEQAAFEASADAVRKVNQILYETNAI